MGLFTSFQLRSRDTETRRRAALSLGVRGRTSAVASLEPLVEDPEWTVRQAAVEALGLVGDVTAAALILSAVRQADQLSDQAGAAAVRSAAVEAFGRIGAPGLPTLVEALRDRHAKLRETAIAALGAIGGSEAAAALAAMLGDERSAVRQAAASALARAAGAGAVPALKRALGHKDPTTRRSAADAFGTLRDPAAVEAVRAAIADRDRPVRDAAIHALSTIGTADAVDALIEGMQAGDRDAKGAIAAALKSFDWTPRDADQRVVHAALYGQFEEVATAGAAAVDPLVGVLADREAASRLGAAAALGRIGDKRAAGPLAALLKDPDASVRQAASDALAALGPASADVIVDALRERSATVRAAAERALATAGEGPIAAALAGRVATGQLTSHGGTDIRVVGTRDELDAARHAADGLDTLLGCAARRLGVETLRSVAALTDVILIEPGEVPSSSDTLDAEPLRAAAKDELRRRGV